MLLTLRDWFSPLILCCTVACGGVSARQNTCPLTPAGEKLCQRNCDRYRANCRMLSDYAKTEYCGRTYKVQCDKECRLDTGTEGDCESCIHEKEMTCEKPYQPMNTYCESTFAGCMKTCP